MQTVRRKRRRSRAGGVIRRPITGGVIRTSALMVGPLAVAAVVLILVLGSGAGARPRGRFESMLQDDQMLLYDTSNASVNRTLQTLKSLGVDRIRLTVNWHNVAPDAGSQTVPAFDATNPAAYPQSGWAPYDRIDLLAAKYGIAVDFDLSGPGPLWAAQANPHDAQVAAGYGLGAAAFARVQYVFGLNAAAFRQFVIAAGRRYDGSYHEPLFPTRVLPRVSFWSVWNEPNQPGWLAPQSRQAGGSWVPESPWLYRGYVDAAAAALAATGHAHDTLLIGELAPEGCLPRLSAGCSTYPRIDQPLPPITFLQSLYCVDQGYRPLTGPAAAAVGCPASGGPRAFVRAHPALFTASAFAHHPYAFLFPPNLGLPEPEYVPLANLSRLEIALDETFTRYGVHRKIPLYLDEYGYETDPPNPYKGKSPALQSTFLNQATWMAARDPRVEGLSQFLLVDSAPDAAYPPGSRQYWSTFQTGLEYLNRQAKPSLQSYRLPVFLPSGSVARGGELGVWGMLRAAANGTTQRATVQWSPSASAGYRTLATVTTHQLDGIFRTRVRLPGNGVLRVRWVSASGVALDSRAIPVRAG